MKLSDTNEDAQKVQLEILTRMGPEGRLRAGIELSRMSRLLLAEGIRTRHPDYDEHQVRLAAIRLTLPADLFHAAYPDADSCPP
ncbi:MAG: hypothetical protein ACM3MN_03410 [Nitrospirota bacterium]